MSVLRSVISRVSLYVVYKLAILKQWCKLWLSKTTTVELLPNYEQTHTAAPARVHTAGARGL